MSIFASNSTSDFRQKMTTLARVFSRKTSAFPEQKDACTTRLRKLQFRADIGAALAEHSDMGALLQACADICLDYTGAVLVRICLLNGSEEGMRVCAPADSKGSGRSAVHGIMEAKQPYISEDPLNDPRVEDNGFISEQGIRYYAGYPMTTGSGVIGFVECFARERFSGEMLTELDAAAAHMAGVFERMRREERFGRLLEEKDVLLREIHHRVKNNMQVIASLLNLQSEAVPEKRYSEMFLEAQNRIKVMALIHEKLYRAEDRARIDFGDYVSGLANSLLSSYGVNIGSIALSIDVRDITLGVDSAIPCGLIVNELLSNALKHAFPGDRNGEVRVSMRRCAAESAERPVYELTVSDNGVGLPGTLDIRNTVSLGLRLVTSLAEHQLQGKLEKETDGGTMFRITFTERNDSRVNHAKIHEGILREAGDVR